MIKIGYEANDDEKPVKKGGPNPENHLKALHQHLFYHGREYGIYNNCLHLRKESLKVFLFLP